MFDSDASHPPVTDGDMDQLLAIILGADPGLVRTEAQIEAFRRRMVGPPAGLAEPWEMYVMGLRDGLRWILRDGARLAAHLAEERYYAAMFDREDADVAAPGCAGGEGDA